MAGLGMIGAVQLWRFRNSGRLAVMGLAAMSFLAIPIHLILIRAMTVRDWIASLPGDWASHSLAVAVVLLLTSRTTRALCADVRTPEHVDEGHGAA